MSWDVVNMLICRCYTYINIYIYSYIYIPVYIPTYTHVYIALYIKFENVFFVNI